MKPLVMIPCALMLTWASALAADFELTGWATWMDPTEEKGAAHFDTQFGVGAGLNVFWSDRFSTEFAINWVKPDALVFRGTDIGQVLLNTEGLSIVPLTAVVQYHFRPKARWAPYVGAGAAWVIFDDVERGELGVVEDVKLDEDYGFVLNAGMKWNFSERWGLDVNAKYVPVDSEAAFAIAGGSGEVGFSPLIYSAGLTYRF